MRSITICSLLWCLLAAYGVASGQARHGPIGLQVPLAILTLAAAVVLVRRLVGPVFFYEVVRTSRRGRVFLLRSAFALGLLAFLWLAYSRHEDTHLERLARMLTRASGTNFSRFDTAADVEFLAAIRAAEMARLAETFFFVFMCVQFAAVLLLTPAYTAATIAEEKERHRLEFLLTTNLSDREIVLGKFLACLANLTLLFLTGLPVLAILQLLGGVDPDLVLAGFMATGATMFSLGALGMFNSVYSSKPRDAILLTYLGIVAYVMVSLAFLVPLEYLKRPPRVAPVWSGIGPPPLMVGVPKPPLQTTFFRPLIPLLESFNTGNPVIMLTELKNDWDSGVPLAVALPPLIGNYVLFHLLLGALCTGIAVLRMRAAAWPVGRADEGGASRRRFRLFRPALGTNPMLWKEVVADPGLGFLKVGKIIVLLIVLVSFTPLLWLIGKFLLNYVGGPHAYYTDPWFELQMSINTWVRLAGSGVACLTLVGVAVRAASAICGERERETLDSLLATHLGGREILFAKWLGSILSVRGAWFWLVTIWALGVLSGGLHLSTLPWLVLAWFVYAAAFAMVGLRLSLAPGGTMRATLVTLVILATLCFAHWLPWFFARLPANPQFPLTLQMYGLTPPAALGWLSFHGDSIAFDPLAPMTAPANGITSPLDIFLGIVVGLVAWAALALALWANALHRFEPLRQGCVREREDPRSRSVAADWNGSTSYNSVESEPPQRPDGSIVHPTNLQDD